jgi:ribosomal protein S18 acetylase RimI-like enzyme
MIPLTSVDSILSIITRIKTLNKGNLTNFFLDIPKSDLWIKLNLILYEEIGETVFIFRNNQGFYNLFYITTDITTFKRDFEVFCRNNLIDIFVVDIVGRIQDIEEIKSIFTQAGFFKYTSLVRMSKIQTQNENSHSDKETIFYSGANDQSRIFDLLQIYFDPYAEQLPLIDEIISWSKNKNILIYSDDNFTIQGFLIYELKGLTSYLRYWFVHPDYRDKKIGSALLRKFLAESSSSKRQLFWVIESNDNAIKRYEHYGFSKETLVDCIMINRNIYYGG